jgi:PIN domain nuclease of toxin-antitoxin system
VRFLLDTHVLLWLLAGSARIGDAVLATLADQRHQVFVSAVSGWEIAIKVGLGRLDVPPDLRSWLPAAINASGVDVLQVSLEHTLGVEALPHHHRDPFDRLLIAQAITEDMTLVTADRQFDQYDVRLLRC